MKVSINVPVIAAIVMCAMGCKKSSVEPPDSLIVIDANGKPPEEGFAVFVQETDTIPIHPEALTSDMMLGEIMHWDHASGELQISGRAPSTNIVVYSPDPFEPEAWRHELIELNDVDTVRMPIRLHVRIDMRLNRTQGAPIEEYAIQGRNTTDGQKIIARWPGSQIVQFVEETISVTSFPMELSLTRKHVNSENTLFIQSEVVEYEDAASMLRFWWSDSDKLNP